jgi:hypothetical protein
MQRIRLVHPDAAFAAIQAFTKAYATSESRAVLPTRRTQTMRTIKIAEAIKTKIFRQVFVTKWPPFGHRFILYKKKKNELCHSRQKKIRNNAQKALPLWYFFEEAAVVKEPYHKIHQGPYHSDRLAKKNQTQSPYSYSQVPALAHQPAWARRQLSRGGVAACALSGMMD